MKMTKIFAFLVALGMLLCVPKAWAAKNFTITLVNAPVVVTMGDPAGTVLTYQIKNTNTGLDVVDNINKMEFNLNAPYTWSASTTAPAGWSVTRPTTTKLVFTTSTSMIATGSTQSFSLVLGIIPQGTQDSTDLLRSVIATYDDTRQKILNNQASTSWTRKSLAINSFTAVDSVTGQAASSPGVTLTVTLSVTNRSTSNWTGIVSVPQPPTANITWTTGSTTITTTNNPSINLNSGQTGTLVWTYTIGSSCSVGTPPAGTVYFSVTNVRDSTNSATSKSAVSNTVNIGCFSAAITLSNNCAASGGTVTVTMTLTNRYANNITGATPTLTPGGTATKTLSSGPTPASVSVSANGGTATITWVYTITGTSGQTYLFTGSATGTLQSTPTETVSTPIATSLTTGTVSGASPGVTISTSTGSALTTDRNQSATLIFDIPNSLCSDAISGVAITLPSAAWVPQDSSSVINNAGFTYDNWTSTISGSVVSFTAAGTNLAIAGTGDFAITFSLIPSAATYTFPIVLTLAAGGTVSTSATVTVGAPGLGLSSPGLFKENY